MSSGQIRFVDPITAVIALANQHYDCKMKREVIEIVIKAVSTKLHWNKKMESFWPKKLGNT